MEISKNRKAFHDYEIVEKFLAGMSLVGPEVKALQARKVSLKEAFVSVNNGEVFLENCHMSIPDYVTIDRPDEKRDRKLLLNKREIRHLESEVQKAGMTIVPLRIIKTRGLFKIEIGLAKGLKKYDKRQKLKEKDQKRDIQRTLKDY